MLPVEGGDVVLAGALVIGDESVEADGVVECGLWCVRRERGFAEEFVDARGADGGEEFALGVGPFVADGGADVERARRDE